MPKGTFKEVNSVAEKLFEVMLPEELVANFGWREAEVPARIREALVMELLRLDRLSEAQAAAILGLNRWQLVDLMGQHRVPAIRMNPKELKQEVAGANRQNE
jgi:hypothetical protein